MAFYLHRAFATDPAVFVLNDVRLVDPDQAGPDGRDGVCQIDHLLVHRHGLFVVESKSVTEEVAVRSDGEGGDEWTRRSGGRERGMPSPIQQARRQGEFLRTYLQRRQESLLGLMPIGMRTLSKLINGTIQRGFALMPIQIVVAVSDNGRIKRAANWSPPTEPFQTFVSKADLVPEKIREELASHRKSASLLGDTEGEYGMWAMKPDEASAVAARLDAEHAPGNHTPVQPRTRTVPTVTPMTKPPARTPQQVRSGCRHCGGADLIANWGKYGYYWHCGSCDKNTAIPTVCSACGADGKRGKGVRVRKDGPTYFRVCEECGIDEVVWRAT